MLETSNDTANALLRKFAVGLRSHILAALSRILLQRHDSVEHDRIIRTVRVEGLPRGEHIRRNNPQGQVDTYKVANAHSLEPDALGPELARLLPLGRGPWRTSTQLV